MRNNMINKKNLIWLIAGLMALFFGAGRNAYADGISDTITVDTSGLPSTPGSEIVFYLIDGSGTGDGNNTATLGSFGFGGGSAGTVDSVNTTGGVSGDMTSAITITDSSFTNVLAEYFMAGSSLSFLLNLTTNVDAGPTPDQFGFAILDPSGNPVPTSDPTGNDNLLIINIDSSDPAVTTYSDSVTVTPAGPVSTPEPGTLLMLCSGMIALGLVRSRTKSLRRARLCKLE